MKRLTIRTDKSGKQNLWFAKIAKQLWNCEG